MAVKDICDPERILCCRTVECSWCLWSRPQDGLQQNIYDEICNVAGVPSESYHGLQEWHEQYAEEQYTEQYFRGVFKEEPELKAQLGKVAFSHLLLLYYRIYHERQQSSDNVDAFDVSIHIYLPTRMLPL